ncbi:hypothetical protein LY76DRAFT_105745 [Colletotrichum caudatum]|nr:hypothetical protein LY76DRAFT_105745 [Colletotrichum caudatum]
MQINPTRNAQSFMVLLDMVPNRANGGGPHPANGRELSSRDDLRLTRLTIPGFVPLRCCHISCCCCFPLVFILFLFCSGLPLRAGCFSLRQGRKEALGGGGGRKRPSPFGQTEGATHRSPLFGNATCPEHVGSAG